METQRNYTNLLQVTLQSTIRNKVKKPQIWLFLAEKKNWVEAEYDSKNFSEYYRSFFQITDLKKII